MATRDNVLAFARRMEALGYDSLWAELTWSIILAQPPRFGLRLQLQLAPQQPDPDLLLAQGCLPSARVGVQAHQDPVHGRSRPQQERVSRSELRA